MKRIKRTVWAVISAIALVMFTQAPVSAASSATPNPAVPGDEVSITYTDRLCGSSWVNLANLDEGVLVVDWPDGTQTLVDPVTTPVVVTVPAGMQAGTASISLHKAFIGNGEYEECRGSFTIAEDANIPVLDTTVVFGVGALTLAGLVVLSRRRMASV